MQNIFLYLDDQQHRLSIVINYVTVRFREGHLFLRGEGNHTFPIIYCIYIDKRNGIGISGNRYFYTARFDQLNGIGDYMFFTKTRNV